MPTTTRGALPYPAETDVPDVPVDMQELAERIAAIMAIDQQGPLGSRPAAGNAGNYYTDTATGITYRDDGTQWRALNLPVGGVPTGSVIFVPNDADMSSQGYLKCNGQAVSRATYSALFTFGGTSSPFGAGDGSTTFNVPDYQGRKLVGKGTNTTVDTVGKNDGLAASSRSAAHTHTHGLQMPSHVHDMQPGGSIQSTQSGIDFWTWNVTPGAHYNSGSAGPTAVTGSINNATEPYSVGNFWIKT